MIPKVIWQTHEYDFEDLPYPYNLNAKTWIDKNPRYKYKYVNGAGRRSQIELLRPDLLEAYDGIPGNVYKSDIWRYVVLSEYGGFYADIDSVCIKPLNLDLTKDFISITNGGYQKCNGYKETFEFIETNHVDCSFFTKASINNSHFACSPKNEILYSLLNTVKNNFKKSYPNGVGMYEMGHYHITDPLTFSNTLLEYREKVSESIVNYEMQHYKSTLSCLDGDHGKEIEICHGLFHHTEYIAVD